MTGIAIALLLTAGVVAQSTQETVYEAGPGITLPKVVKEVHATYPKDALNDGIQGSVEMRCVVSTDGKPTAIEVTKPLEPRLDEAAVSALRQWEFEPGKKDNQAVPVRITIEMTFRVK